MLGGPEINLPYFAPNPLRGVASSFAEASEDKSKGWKKEFNYFMRVGNQPVVFGGRSSGRRRVGGCPLCRFFRSGDREGNVGRG